MSPFCSCDIIKSPQAPTFILNSKRGHLHRVSSRLKFLLFFLRLKNWSRLTQFTPDVLWINIFTFIIIIYIVIKMSAPDSGSVQPLESEIYFEVNHKDILKSPVVWLSHLLISETIRFNLSTFQSQPVDWLYQLLTRRCFIFQVNLKSRRFASPSHKPPIRILLPPQPVPHPPACPHLPKPLPPVSLFPPFQSAALLHCYSCHPLSWVFFPPPAQTSTSPPLLWQQALQLPTLSMSHLCPPQLWSQGVLCRHTQT